MPDAPGALADATVDALALDTAPDAPPPVLDPFDGARSGSRIKMRWWGYADGAKQWVNDAPFYDAVLAVDCRPGHLDSDTRQWCIPTGMLAVNYSDSTCQTQIVVQNQSPFSQYVALYPYTPTFGSPPATFGATHIYRLGAATTGDIVYYKDPNGACQAWGSYSGSNFYTIGAEVTSLLAEMTTSVPTSGALGGRYVESADGFRYPVSLHDATEGYDCHPLHTWATVPGSTSTVCAPASVWNTAYYSEGSCTQGAMFVNASSVVPTYVGVPPRSGCPADPASFYFVGSAITPSAQSAWDPKSQSCKPSSLSGVTFYGLGSSVSTQALARGPGAQAGQRIQRIHYTNGPTSYPELIVGYDTVMHTECAPVHQPDGTFPCLPFAYPIYSYFSDAACTTAIELAENHRQWPNACTTPAPYGFAVTTDASEFVHVYSVGSKYAGTIYFLNGASCEVYPSPAAAEYYMVGAEIPSSSFANATLEVDP